MLPWLNYEIKAKSCVTVEKMVTHKDVSLYAYQ